MTLAEALPSLGFILASVEWRGLTGMASGGPVSWTSYGFLLRFFLNPRRGLTSLCCAHSPGPSWHWDQGLQPAVSSSFLCSVL